VPEGDTLHRAANRLRPLVGEQLKVEVPHPRARAALAAVDLDGRRLESVEAVGKNLILRFEGGVVLRSHLRMSGRWSLRPRGEARAGKPWLVLRGSSSEGVLWNGPVLELHTRALMRLGPDILARPPAFEVMLERMRGADGERWLGEILQDQSVVAGIGNMWMAESLWQARISPWQRLRDVSEDERRRVLETAATLMRASVDTGREGRKQVHAHAGRPCPRCGTLIRSKGQGDDNRIVYWCPACQVATAPK
jgi:endonuclease-8